MFEKNAEFVTEPASIECVALPDGVNDVWLRKNIGKMTRIDTTNEDNEQVIAVFVAEEAYMRKAVAKTELEANFNEWFEIAKAWQPQQNDNKISIEDRVKTIERMLIKNLLSEKQEVR